MGKSIKIWWVFAIVSVLPLLAENTEFSFVGLGTGASKVNFDDNTTQQSERNAVFSLQLGKQTRKLRTTFNFDYGKNLLSTGIAIDYIPFDMLFGTPIVRPYLGLHSQYIRYDKKNMDDDGFAWGAQTGFVIYATDSIDVDLSYRYSFIQSSDTIDTMDSFSISLHYFFE